MTTSKYNIVEKIMSGIEVVGFIVENSESKERTPLKMSDVIKLARNNKFNNASALFDVVSGSYMISLDCSLKDLPVYIKDKDVKLKITSRILNSDGECTGYKVTDSSGKSYKLSSKKIWELAEQGRVENLEAKINNKSKILISNDKSLEKMYIFQS